LLGVDLAITPVGRYASSIIVKSNKIIFVIIAGLLLGFFISIAEPGLIVLSEQVKEITSGQISFYLFLILVSIGLAIMIVLGLVRIVYRISFRVIILISYLIILIIALFTSDYFLALAFDASGATTGILAVPFLLALSFGLVSMRKDSKNSESDSFGLVAIASTGPIIIVMLLGGFVGGSLQGGINVDSGDTSIIKAFIDIIIPTLLDTLLVISPLALIFVLMQIFSLKLRRRQLRRIVGGFIYTFLGLFIFLVGVNAGFSEGGRAIGQKLAENGNDIVLLLVGFVVGVIVIIAEPAVSVLVQQVEDVTTGYVRRRDVLFFLAIGAGLAISFSVLRVLIPSIKIWYFLLPGYIIAMTLSFFTPKLFVGIGFDSGGVATGPITITFVLPFIQGIALVNGNNGSLGNIFGVIALTAMFPIISLEILGIIYKIKTKKENVTNNE
jgi:hypothetical protein